MKMALTSLCFSFKGRISRTTFWKYQGFLFCMFILILMMPHYYILQIVLNLTMLLMLFTNFTVCIKRMQDRGKSVWHFLLGAFLFICISQAVLILSKIGEFSRYGTISPADIVSDPAGHPIGAAICGIIIYTCIFCGCLKGNPEANRYGEPPK